MTPGGYVKIVKDTTITLTPGETLTILSGLTYITEDTERHSDDIKDAIRLKKKLLKAVNDSVEVIQGDEEYGNT